jgi:hypothetical protein
MPGAGQREFGGILATRNLSTIMACCQTYPAAVTARFGILLPNQPIAMMGSSRLDTAARARTAIICPAGGELSTLG